jgi:hypothetical protein
MIGSLVRPSGSAYLTDRRSAATAASAATVIE